MNKRSLIQLHIAYSLLYTSAHYYSRTAHDLLATDGFGLLLLSPPHGTFAMTPPLSLRIRSQLRGT
jgi:hypothetical protein